MDAIKALVERSLEKKRVLSQMKAELRAQVFLAIDEEESAAGYEGLAAKTRNPQREGLLATEEGKLLTALVREFLEWAGLEFTAKVFEPEVGPAAEYHGRMGLSKQLGMTADAASRAPLLLKVLQQSQGAAPQSSLPAMSAARPQATTSGNQSSNAPAASSQHSEQSYDNSFEIESDEGLAGAEVDDEEEEYSAVLAKNNPPSTTQQPPSSSNRPGVREERTQLVLGDEGMDLSASSLSTSGFMAGRIRRPRGESPGHNTSQGGGHFDQSDDLMTSDRSGNISHELDGMAPPSHRARGHNQGLGDSGGLSLSGEMPGDDYEEEEGESAMSRSDLPDNSRPSRPLEPLKPAGSLGKLGPLAPLGGAGKLGALPGAPRALSPPGKQGDQLKEELYRSGLLPTKSKEELQEEEDEHSSVQEESIGSSGAASQRSSAQGVSYNDEPPLEPLESPGRDSFGSNPNLASKASTGSRGYDESKAISMDLRDTGLSASDQSGDLEVGGVDMQETVDFA